MNEPVGLDAAARAPSIVAFFEGFAPADLRRLDAFYTPGARFKDPFNEVQGLPAIERVYAHMFEALEAPRFAITSCIAQRSECFMAWEFHFRFRRFRPEQAQVVRGGSHLLLAEDGRILVHRDYWDPAEEVYEKLPLLRGLMRWLRRRAST